MPGTLLDAILLCRKGFRRDMSIRLGGSFGNCGGRFLGDSERRGGCGGVPTRERGDEEGGEERTA